MKNYIVGFSFSVLSTLAMGQTEDFVFKNEFRPEYKQTVTIEQFTDLQAEGNTLILDVRLLEDFEKDPHLIPGATYVNPEELPSCISNVDQSKEVVVYCVAGKWVSQKVAHLLSQSGISVSSLEGGIESWKAEQSQ